MHEVGYSPFAFWWLLADDDTSDFAAAWAIYEIEFLIKMNALFWNNDVGEKEKLFLKSKRSSCLKNANNSDIYIK